MSECGACGIPEESIKYASHHSGICFALLDYLFIFYNKRTSEPMYERKPL